MDSSISKKLVNFDESLSKSHSHMSKSGTLPLISVDQNIVDDFRNTGSIYYEEASRILTHMPKFPSKYMTYGKGSRHDKQRVSSEQLQHSLEEYMNAIIGFSPLICNLYFLRDFLTNTQDSAENSQMDLEADSFRLGKDDENLESHYLSMGLTGKQPSAEMGLFGAQEERTTSFNPALKSQEIGQSIDKSKEQTHTSLNHSDDGNVEAPDDQERFLGARLEKTDSFYQAFDEFTNPNAQGLFK